MRQLTARQAKFIDEYALNPCAASAARAAGYSHKGAKVIGCNLLTNSNLQAALAVKRAEFAQKVDIDRDVVVGGIIGAIALARSRADAGNMIRGSIELAKLLGFYNPEVQRDVGLSAESQALEARLEGLSDDALLAIIESGYIAA